MPFGLWSWNGPRNYGPRKKRQFLGKGSTIVKYRDLLPWAVQNSWTDRFAIWVVNSGGPKAARVQLHSSDGANVHNFSRICQMAPMYPSTLCSELCKNGWTDRFGIWTVDSGGLKEVQVQSYSPGGANVPHLANTIEPAVCGGDAVLCQITLTTCYTYDAVCV